MWQSSGFNSACQFTKKKTKNIYLSLVAVRLLAHQCVVWLLLRRTMARCPLKKHTQVSGSWETHKNASYTKWHVCSDTPGTFSSDNFKLMRPHGFIQRCSCGSRKKILRSVAPALAATSKPACNARLCKTTSSAALQNCRVHMLAEKKDHRNTSRRAHYLCAYDDGAFWTDPSRKHSNRHPPNWRREQTKKDVQTLASLRAASEHIHCLHLHCYFHQSRVLCGKCSKLTHVKRKNGEQWHGKSAVRTSDRHTLLTFGFFLVHVLVVDGFAAKLHLNARATSIFYYYIIGWAETEQLRRRW